MISISWPLLVTQIVTFLVAMVIVWKLFWKPLTAMMQDRSRKIADDLARAENGRKQAEALEAEYKQRLEEIAKQAQATLNEAMIKGDQAREEILQEARHEAQRILEQASRDLALERERLIRELRGQVADLTLLALDRLLEQNLDPKVQKKFLDDFFRDVEGSGRLL